MSKIGQRVRYEREIAKAEITAHRELVAQAIDYERRITDGHVAARDKIVAYERKLTDSQFGKLDSLNGAHAVFHDREHILYEQAVEKATSALNMELDVVRKNIQGLDERVGALMSTGRFEREHAQLIERIDTKFATYDEKLATEEKVTVRQGAQEEVLEKVRQTNRWMIGIAVTVAIFGLTTLLHAFGII